MIYLSRWGINEPSLEQIVCQIDELRGEIACLQAVLRGTPSREEALNAQRIVGPLRTASVLNELAVRQATVGQLTRRARVLENPIDVGSAQR